MTVQLSSLRVSMEGDSSSYVASAKAVEDANKRMADTGQAAGAALAAQDAAVGKTGGTLARLQKTYVDGYGSASKFYGAVGGLQKQFELGNVSADRATVIYEGISKRYGMVADAADVAKTGNADFAKVVDTVNGKLGTNVVALNTAATAHGGLTTQAMSAQHAVRGFTEMMIQGVPVSRALAMELNNISYAATGPDGLIGALKGGLSAFSQLLTPMVLMVGIPAAIAGGFALLYSSIKTSEIEFANLSDRVGSTLKQLHGLQSGAALSAGIGESDFLTQMQKFGDLVAQAQHELGGLAQTFTANGVQAKSFNDYLAKAADLVANATSQQEKYRIVQALGLPATYQWVQYLSQGGDFIMRAANEANGFGDAAERRMIAKARDFDTAWSRTWQSFANSAKTAVIDVADYMEHTLGQGSFWKNLALLMTMGHPTGYAITHPNTPPNGRVSDAFRTLGSFNFNNPELSKALNGGKPTVLPQDLKRAIDLQQQYLGMLGNTASIAQQVESESLKIAAYELNPGAIKLTETQVENLKRLAEQRALGTYQMKQQADSMRIEVGSFGPSASAAGWKVVSKPSDGKREGRGDERDYGSKAA